MTRPVVHFEILGKDGKKLQDFYSALFGWGIDANNPMNYGMVQPVATQVGGGVAASQDGKPMVTFYVQVPDINETLKKAESLGGKTVMPQMDVPGGPTIAQLGDPEGNVIGLVKE